MAKNNFPIISLPITSPSSSHDYLSQASSTIFSIDSVLYTVYQLHRAIRKHTDDDRNVEIGQAGTA